MDWTLLVGVSSVIVANLVTIITLYIHLDNKTEDRLAKITDLLGAIQNEMRDFHGRLCEIEAKNRK